MSERHKIALALLGVVALAVFWFMVGRQLYRNWRYRVDDPSNSNELSDTYDRLNSTAPAQHESFALGAGDGQEAIN